MKWGRRKSSSPSPSLPKPSLFSSWLSKLKKMASTNDPAPEPEPEAGHGLVKLNGKKEEKGRSSWSSMGSAANGAPGEGGGRFYGDGDGIGGLRSSFKVSVKVKELPEEKEIEIKTPRKGSVKEMRFRSNHRRVLEERLSKLEEEEEEIEARSTKTVHKHVLNMEPKSVSEQILSNGQQKLKELKLKAERHRKSYYITRELQGRGGAGAKSSNKIRVYSPRTPTKSEICKIRALEDLKRARTRARKKTTVLESLAVVKCSVDPEKDFRDSMMEMILEEGIGKPEELEELLACYLTLNADEYHDLIIRVFRQVWLELNEACARSEIIHEEECCYV